jgi:hypothetical protein
MMAPRHETLLYMSKIDRQPRLAPRPFFLSYFLRPIILFANMDVSRHILVIDTFILAKSNMDRREYINRHDSPDQHHLRLQLSIPKKLLASTKAINKARKKNDSIDHTKLLINYRDTRLFS